MASEVFYKPRLDCLLAGAACMHKQTGKTLYAQAEIVTGEDNTASLVFEISNEIFPGMEKVFPAIEFNAQFNKNALPQDTVGWAKSYVLFRSDQLLIEEGALHPLAELGQENCEKVERAIVNLSLSDAPFETPEGYTNVGLVGRIGKFCREAFPKMQAKQSSFNVTLGNKECQVDSILSPQANIDEGIYVLPFVQKVE